MGSGYSKMKKQAKAFEQQFGQMKDSMKNTEITGISGNGLVTVILSGDKEIKQIKIKEECVDPQDVEGLQDLIKAACQDAYRQLSQKETPNLPPGLSLPFGFPG